MEVCFQISTLTATATTSACVLQAPQNISSKKIIMPSCSGLRISSLCSSSNPSLSLTYRRRHGSKIVCETSNVIDKVLVANDSSWKSLVIGSQSPVLVEFWAPWCGPCRMIAPVIDELAKEYAGKLVCFKVNTDDCPSIATEYGIRSIPTVLFFQEWREEGECYWGSAKVNFVRYNREICGNVRKKCNQYITYNSVLCNTMKR